MLLSCARALLHACMCLSVSEATASAVGPVAGVGRVLFPNPEASAPRRVPYSLDRCIDDIILLAALVRDCLMDVECCSIFG